MLSVTVIDCSLLTLRASLLIILANSYEIANSYILRAWRSLVYHCELVGHCASSHMWLMIVRVRAVYCRELAGPCASSHMWLMIVRVRTVYCRELAVLVQVRICGS